MSIAKPFHRIWRPLKGYNPFEIVNLDKPRRTIDYLVDDRFACQAEMRSLVTTAHLIIHDLYELFNYIEPDNSNLGVFSHRIYELFLRSATEFEANCKGILDANGYAGSGNLNVKDYFKIALEAKLYDYIVIYDRWTSHYVFKPFIEWNVQTYTPLTWYQQYNEVKHNRYHNFHMANLENLMNAISGLLCILHAQYGEEMQSACFEGISMAQDSEAKVETGTFNIIAPTFQDAEQYDFVWNDIKNQPDPVQIFNF